MSILLKFPWLYGMMMLCSGCQLHNTSDDVMCSVNRQQKDICDHAFRNLCQGRFNEARSQFEDVAEQGSLSARLFLVFLYGEGIGTKPDCEKMEKWMLTISADMKAKNEQEKIRFYRRDFEWMSGLLKEKIDNQKVLGAVYGNVAYMYLRGWGTEKNPQHSFDYAEKAVQCGNIFSYYELGKMYQDGIVVGQDFQKAYLLYKVAADNGNAFASYQLGIMYRDGLGVEKDEIRARAYFQQAAFVVKKKEKNKQ